VPSAISLAAGNTAFFLHFVVEVRTASGKLRMLMIPPVARPRAPVSTGARVTLLFSSRKV
jgi:hypothetical protein